MVTPAISVQDFDPNQPPKGSSLYGVYDGRSFRVAIRRVTAIQWVHNNTPSTLWELINGHWVQRAYKESQAAGTPCSMCRAPVGPRDWSHGYGHAFEKQGGRISDALKLLYLCTNCFDINAHS